MRKPFLFVPLALVLVMGMAPSVFGQVRENKVIDSCGDVSLRVGDAAYTYVDKNGNQCTNATPGAAGATAEKQDEQTVILGEIRDEAASGLPVPTVGQATATGGTTGCDQVTTASTNAKSCGTAPTAWYGMRVLNTSTTIAWLRRYNTAGTPTCSSATGYVDSIPIPPASASGRVGGIVERLAVPETSKFTTGLGWCVTGGSSSTDSTSAPAGIYIEVYKKQ